MNINLREEETDAYISFYQSYLDEIQRLNKKATDVLNEVMQQSKYDKLQQRISGMIDAYSDTIASHIESGVFAAWEESAGSLRACLRAYRSGDAADEVCAFIERQMGGMMRDTLKIEKADLMITERPVVSEDGMERLEQICRSAHARIQDIKSDYLSQAADREKDNEIYGTLKPLFEGISANIEAFFEASYHSFVQLHDFVKDLSARLHNIAEENGAAPNKGSGGTGSVNHFSAAENSDIGNSAAENSDTRNQAAGDSSERNPADEGTVDFSGENFNEENIALAVRVVEIIVNQAGAVELNFFIEQHDRALTSSRQGYAGRVQRSMAAARRGPAARRGMAAAQPTAQRNAEANNYGRYTVTPKSIRMMAPAFAQVHSVIEPIDKFYKEKFEALGSNFEKANKVIHGISTFLGLWGLGTWNLSKLFSSEDSDKSILEKISLGGVALSSCTKAVMLINGGAHLVKILDWAMPFLKKSRFLVKLSEKVWKHTRQDIQIPYIHKMIDLYVMEHYEIKHGMKAGKSPYFNYYHSVTAEMDDNNQRRALENSIFAAETMLTPENYDIKGNDPVKVREICCGIFLNLVRSGMCSRQDIEPGKANEIVDRLYHIYIAKENVTPRVEINPDYRRAV